MQSKFYLFLIIVIWSLLLAFILPIWNEKINSDILVAKNGLVIDARCVKSRSWRSVKFNVKYDSEENVREDLIFLPVDVMCNEELLNRFNKKRIEILAYKNHYLGIVVDGLTIQDAELGIRKFNDKNNMIYFAFFVALIFSIALLMKIRHQKKQTKKT